MRNISNINYLIILLSLMVLLGCSNKKNQKQVIIYTSVDQIYSSKIFKDFEQKTGIQVLAVYDTEASKAIGLEKRILAEKAHPRADIFWNSEPIRTARLAKQGLFQTSPNIVLPLYKNSFYYATDRTWFGIGERRRVIIVNTNLVLPKDYPLYLHDIWNEKYKGKVAISSPYIGTAATHFAALYHEYGEIGFKKLLSVMKQAETSYVAGNSVVKDVVGAGKYPIGLVDTDDAIAGINAGLPLKMIYYNQKYRGSFSIFGTVAMLKSAPNQNEATRFLQYLLTKETEQKLIDIGAVQFSVLEQSTTSSPQGWGLNPEDLLDDLKISYSLMKELL